MAQIQLTLGQKSMNDMQTQERFSYRRQSEKPGLIKLNTKVLRHGQVHWNKHGKENCDGPDEATGADMKNVHECN